VVTGSITDPLLALSVNVVTACVLTNRTKEPLYPDVHPGSTTVSVESVPAGTISAVSVPDEIVTVPPVVGELTVKLVSTSCWLWVTVVADTAFAAVQPIHGGDARADWTIAVVATSVEFDEAPCVVAVAAPSAGPFKLVMSVFAPDAAAPRLERAALADVAPVPPFNTATVPETFDANTAVLQLHPEPSV